MKLFSQSLISEMDTQLKAIHALTDNPISYSEQSVGIIIPILERLKVFFLKHKFTTVTQEIDFFREIKPQFAHRLIFYNEIYNIETNNNSPSTKKSRKYYQHELMRFQKHFTENREFYRYMRTGNTLLDSQYFVRGKHNLHFTLDSACFQADTRFSTSHDYKVAQLMANEKINNYLAQEIKKLGSKVQKDSPLKVSGLRWTGSNAALVELIYALHSEAVINEGKVDLTEIVKTFETVFDINLGQFNRTFLEIRDRKSDRAKFLSALRENLIIRMDRADNR